LMVSDLLTILPSGCYSANRSAEARMANPMERKSPATSTVASCNATDCVHNENHSCHAGEIHVEMGAQGAICGTYESSRAKSRP
jgi:hypothetical protein